MIRLDPVKVEDIQPGDVLAADEKGTRKPFACLVYFVAHTSKGVAISFLSSTTLGPPTVTEAWRVFEFGTPMAKVTQME